MSYILLSLHHIIINYEMKKYLLMFAMWLTTTYCVATDYYCSPNGTGDGTTYAKAGQFTTLLNSLKAGDILYCLGGQYDFSSQISINKSGSATKMVCIYNAPNEKPIFDFRKEAYGSRGIVIQQGSSYIHIKGLTIRYTGKNALHNSGSNCIFENIDAYGNGDTGIQMKAGGNNLILNCDSHDNFDYELANDFGGNADGFADKQYTGGGNIYRGCRAWNNSDDGWDFYQRVNEGGTVTILENCVCYKNGPEKYDMRNHPRYDTDKAWFDQFKNGKSVTFRNAESAVTVTLENYYNNGNGNGFKLGGDYTNNVVRVVNCLAVGNTVKGFDQNNNDGTMEIYNCSAYSNGSDFNFSRADYGTVIVKNCLTLGGQHTINSKNYTDENNSWNIAGIACDANDFQSLDDNLVLIDRQDDGSLTTTPFMRLVEGSDLIDKGVILSYGYPYSGVAPDLGCFEYGELSYPAVVSCLTNNTTQNIKEGQAIKPIVVEWGGGATGAVVENLPTGLQQQTDEEARTITISGAPAAVGTYDIVVKTVQPDDVTGMTLTIRIVVREDLGVMVAYVTDATSSFSSADTPVLDAIQAAFDVTVFDANSGNNDYSDYDLVVISSVPGSNLTGMGRLKGVDKPVLLLKPWIMKSGVWSWATAQNTADDAMRITQPSHPIFTNVQITDNQLTFFNSVNTNGVTYISQWNSGSTYTELATPLTASGQSIFELPAGGSYGGTTLTEPLLCVGLSEYSMATITESGRQVLMDACKYLIGQPVTSISNHFIDELAGNARKNANTVIYNLNGQRVGEGYRGVVIVNGRAMLR